MTTVKTPEISDPLKRQSVKPLYHQIYDHLLQQIESKQLLPGSQLPAEMDLMKEYQVSRITVRHAISELVSEGVLERHAGKGTFISKPKIDRKLVDVTSFSSRMEAIGLHASAKLLLKEVIGAPINIAQELQIEPGSPLLLMNRLRFSNGDPLALERVHISLNRFKNLEEMDFEESSLYQLLSERYGVKPVKSKKSLEIVMASSEESHLLHLPVLRFPLFLLRATVYGEEYPIEYAKILMRGDRFRFQI